MIRETFNPQIPLTVHWDGKLLPALTGKDNVDRLPVLVSGGGMSKLLGVPKLPSGTGDAMAKAVIDCLDDWNIKARITALSFDTTSSNTGGKSGACTRIETMIGRDLLHLACRHHMMEIVADFVTKTSRRFFTILDLKTEFLTTDPSEWHGCADYRAASDIVGAMKH